MSKQANNPLGKAAENIPYEEFSKWTPQQLTDFLNQMEIPVGNTLIKHKISGDVVGLLTDRDYELLGFTALGDALRVKRAFANFQRKARSAQRNVALWEGEEYILPTCLTQMCFCFQGCTNRDTYKITSTTMALKTKSPVFLCGCIGPLMGPTATAIRFCQGSEFTVDNVDLHLVVDADVTGNTADCCHRTCGIAGQDVVVVESREGNDVHKHHLYLKSGEGMQVVTILRDAVEECRMIR